MKTTSKIQSVINSIDLHNNNVKILEDILESHIVFLQGTNSQYIVTNELEKLKIKDIVGNLICDEKAQVKKYTDKLKEETNNFLNS